MKKKSMKLMAGVLIITLIATGAIALGCSSPATDEAPEIGRMAPDFQLETLDGQTVSLSDYRGQPVLLNFWASWCGPCRFEMPFLQEAYEQYSGQGLVVLGVNLLEETETVREFVRQEGLTFPILLATTQEVPLDYNVRNIPATFLIDSEGRIQDIKIGAFAGTADIEARLGKIMP